MRKQLKVYLLSFLILFVSQTCSKSADGSEITGISPSNFLHGTWSSVVESEKIRYTFNATNIVEENLSYPLGQFKSTNFRVAYPLDEYNIEEELILENQESNQPESYIIRITRKDGGIIDSIIGNTMVYRKFDNVKLFLNGEINETILLNFPGYSGTFLHKE